MLPVVYHPHCGLTVPRAEFGMNPPDDCEENGPFVPELLKVAQFSWLTADGRFATMADFELFIALLIGKTHSLDS